ncbi:MAG TPA: DUF4010 domain-containing protein [Steroidobacteraceae bacterium]|nr:DUF4010 domain-containing protein [Steroidobacteraceae bacterium]
MPTAVALGIGLLIGAERERAKGHGPNREIAGVRTFALVSLLGVFGAFSESTFLLVAFAFLIGALAIAGYIRTRPEDHGITTEVALLATFALGALSKSHPEYSGAAAVIVTVLLAARPWLHEIVKSRVTDRELHDGLLLLAAALIVLPLLPNRTVDPWDVFNPNKMWVVVVLVMAINALGYVGLRLWGPTKGLVLAGVLGGLVSSVTTHGAMAQRAKANSALVGSTAAAATFSSVTTAIFLFTVVSATQPELAWQLAAACAAAAIAAGVCGALMLFRAQKPDADDVEMGRPVSLKSALIFGALVTGVLIGSALLSRWLGPQAAIAGVAVSGFADAHSGAISAAMLNRNGVLESQAAQLAILLCFTANAITKIVVSFIAGPIGFAIRIAIGVAASVSAAWAAWMLTARLMS